MGSQQSSQMMVAPPTVQKLKKYLHLQNENENLTNTSSLCHRRFASTFYKSDNITMDRTTNPFCPLITIKTDTWLTCCMISPIMAVLNVRQIMDANLKKISILPVFNDLVNKIKIRSLISFKNKSVGIVVLEEPYWRVGWAGLSFIKNQQELSKLSLKTVEHSEKIDIIEQKRDFHVQKVKKLKIPKNGQLTESFKMQFPDLKGVIVCKIVEKKPYIIGVQVSQKEIQFFNQQFYREMQTAARAAIKSQGGEREILKQINVHQFEIQTQV